MSHTARRTLWAGMALLGCSLYWAPAVQAMTHVKARPTSSQFSVISASMQISHIVSRDAMREISRSMLRAKAVPHASTRPSTVPAEEQLPPTRGFLASQPQTVTAPSQTGSTLPPTAPSVLKPSSPSNAIPPLPAPLPASVANRGIGTPGQPIPSKATPASSAPGTLPAVAGSASSRRNELLPPGPLSATPMGIAVTPGEVRVSGLGGSSAPWTIVLLLTALTLIPSLLICVTPFARLLVVFHFLRQALGLQTTPSNQTLIGLTLILTFFIMEPVGQQIYHGSFEPLQRGEITAFEAISRGQEPMREFMIHFVREKDAALFLDIAKEPRPHDIRDLSMRVLLPAYIVSELKAGFQIGAVLFLPFLVVDMVVASITTSVGMMQLPPVVISTPLKLLLFLMVDGWHLLISALMRSFQ